MSKISNSVGRNDNFLAKARKLLILPTSLDIFDIRQHYIRILYVTQLLNVCYSYGLVILQELQMYELNENHA